VNKHKYLKNLYGKKKEETIPLQPMAENRNARENGEII